MRSKLRFGAARLRPFFVRHGEKLAAAGVLGLLVSFAVGAAGRETLPDFLRPDSIAAKSDAALANIKGGRPVIIDDWDHGGGDRFFLLANVDWRFCPLSVPPIADLPRRAEPALFRLTELRATALRGAVGINGQLAIPPGALPIPPGVHLPGPQSTGNAEGRHFVLLTGLIPEQMQRQEFDAQFRNAQQPPAVAAGIGAGNAGDVSRDRFTPRYVWCRLERTDTTTGAVKTLDFGDLQEASKDVQRPDEHGPIRLRISPEYTALLRDVARWNPKIAELTDPDCIAPSWLTWPLPPLLLHDWGPEAVHLPAIALAAPPAAPAAAVPPPAAPLAAPAGNAEKTAKAAPFKLFRFADFDVQPGHAYRYSVQLVLRNPNYGLPAWLLAQPGSAASPYLLAPWSEKSVPVAIPPDARVLAAGASQPRRGPVRAKLAIMVWDQKDGLDLVLDLTRNRDSVSLGAVLNFAGRTVKDVIDPIRRCVRDVRHDFITGAVLLDVRGDPGEALLLESTPHGKTRLTIADEAADRLALGTWRTPSIAPWRG